MNLNFDHWKDGDGWTVGVTLLIVVAALLGIIAVYLSFQGSVQL